MKKTIQYLLDHADVKINGARPWDIQVKNENLYSQVLSNGSLGLGESYMDGWWECESLDQFFDRVLRVRLDKKIKLSKHIIWNAFKSKLINQQNKSGARIVGEKHYDVGNDLYYNMLDKRMTYSCGYYKDTDSLDKAQENKLDLICKKLKLQPEMTLLDIGCGWGSMAKFAAENYGAKVLGITISKEQAKLASKLCKNLSIEIRLEDYRNIIEKFDRIVSIGMFEHVGYKNYHTFMKVVDRCLENKGIFLLHTIAGNTSVTTTDPWIGKYIFPNSMLPSASQITKSCENIFKLEDWHNFGTHYDKTLMAWHKNFTENWDKIKHSYNDRFYRMWNYYLLSCAGSFRARVNQLWQIVFSKISCTNDYESMR